MRRRGFRGGLTGVRLPLSPGGNGCSPKGGGWPMCSVTQPRGLPDTKEHFKSDTAAAVFLGCKQAEAARLLPSCSEPGSAGNILEPLRLLKPVKPLPPGILSSLAWEDLGADSWFLKASSPT